MTHSDNPTDVASGSMLELISFEIAGQEFCIDIRTVREIRGWTPATRIPQTPDYISGVINLRGAVVPVLDLRHRLGLGVTEPSARHVIVVIQHADRVVGLLVDGVQESFQIELERLQAPPSTGLDGAEQFVEGILPLEGRMLSLLIVDALMPRERLRAA